MYLYIWLLYPAFTSVLNYLSDFDAVSPTFDANDCEHPTTMLTICNQICLFIFSTHSKSRKKIEWNSDSRRMSTKANQAIFEHLFTRFNFIHTWIYMNIVKRVQFNSYRNRESQGKENKQIWANQMWTGTF